MNTHNTFYFPRLLQLMFNDLRLQAKPILIIAATVAIFFALMPFHVTGSSTAYFIILYIGGFIITSLAFKDLHDRAKGHLFLMLPCSNLERFLSKWLLTSVIYALGVLIVYYLFSLISVAVNFLIYKQYLYPLNLFAGDLWIGICKYIILQSVILLGAITFKKFAFIKTAFVVGCFFLLLGIFSILVAWIFCPDCDKGMLIFQATLKGSYFIFWIILAPFCWFLTYLKLKEYELK